uniref:Inversin n=1 Tax=Magallana gigas TaxID=29159 RepID=K1PRS0_MAGGI
MSDIQLYNKISGNDLTSTGPDRAPNQSMGESTEENIRKENGDIKKQDAVTQMHAAAVNGDKALLAKIIVSSGQEIDHGDQFGRTPLMFTILADRLECAELLLRAGANVNCKDKGGRTALHWAAHKGNLRMLKLLLSKGASIRDKDNEGQTAVHLCTRHKSPKCMALLLRQLSPGEIDDQDKNKRTALHWAASYGNMEHVKMLIKQDSNIGIPDVEGKTPLHWAASSRDSEAVNCVKTILETTPSVINWQDYEGRTALHLAVADGNEAIVRALTSVENCNVSALDNMFRTPLHWAAVLGHSAVVALLLENGAEYSVSDSNGATPLHYAAQNNHHETVEVFLSCKNVVDEPDIEGRSAFIWAAGKGADNVIKVYLKHNVDIQQVDSHEGTALHASALSGHASSVKLLLDHGAQIDAVDRLKHTALFRACEMGHTSVVQSLIDYGARVDVLDFDGRSPLHWAALGGHSYICQTLIKYGVDPNIRDYSGRTPLQCAAYGGFVNCMSVLIEHKADVNARDRDGMTALHWGCSKGHLDAVKLLIEYQAFPNHMEMTEDRYTPLDYALMGEHHDVAQYMLEQGALSITGIQDLAALSIQKVFRGYRIRKTFSERKKLLMKHDQLRKEAARKRAVEETRKKEDMKHKEEVNSRQKLVFKEMSLVEQEPPPTVKQEEVIEEEEVPKVKERREPKHKKKGVKWQKFTTKLNIIRKFMNDGQRPKSLPSISQGQQGFSQSRSTILRRKERDLSEQEVVLRKKESQKKIKSAEKSRQRQYKLKQKAASKIQKAWKNYKMRQVGILKVAKQSIRTMRLRAGAEEFEKSIAALTIQLAWRKYYRVGSGKLSNMIYFGMKLQYPRPMEQSMGMQSNHGEKVNAPFWHPQQRKHTRPYWAKWIPSPAALSYNFAVDNYHPLASKKGFLPTPFLDETGHPRDFDWKPIEDEDLEKNLRDVRITDNPSRKSSVEDVDIFHDHDLNSIQHQNPLVIKGGEGKPEDCVSYQKVAIIVPYRNRYFHLKLLLSRLHPLLRKQKIHYRIFVIEQATDDSFNRGKLMNVGFKEALKEDQYDCFVFHDVDMIPENNKNLYLCDDHARHLSSAIDEMRYHVMYYNYAGGVIAMKKDVFKVINGYANSYWGWGNEDDDLSARIQEAGYLLTRPPEHIGRYKMVRHKKESRSENGYERFLGWRGRWLQDGLHSPKTMTYKVLSKSNEPLYTNITVDLLYDKNKEINVAEDTTKESLWW